MARGKSEEDRAMLEMALIGYQHQREQIAGKIQELTARLKTIPAAPRKGAAAGPKPAGKRVLSAAARKRIAAAQKKRWAEHRKRLASKG